MVAAQSPAVTPTPAPVTTQSAPGAEIEACSAEARRPRHPLRPPTGDAAPPPPPPPRRHGQLGDSHAGSGGCAGSWLGDAPAKPNPLAEFTQTPTSPAQIFRRRLAPAAQRCPDTRQRLRRRRLKFTAPPPPARRRRILIVKPQQVERAQPAQRQAPSAGGKQPHAGFIDDRRNGLIARRSSSRGR